MNLARETDRPKVWLPRNGPASALAVFVAKLSSPPPVQCTTIIPTPMNPLFHHWILVLINLVCHLSTTNVLIQTLHTHTQCAQPQTSEKKRTTSTVHTKSTRDITVLMSCHLGGNRLWSATKKLTKQTFLHLSRSQLWPNNMFHQNPTRIWWEIRNFFLGISHGKSP